MVVTTYPMLGLKLKGAPGIVCGIADGGTISYNRYVFFS